MAITETLSVTTSTTSLTTSVGATDRELVKLYHVVASPASISLISSSLYTITGYSDTSQALSIVFDDWTDYVGDSILVVIYTDIDTGNVADAMLTNFGTAANISPTTLQNEMAHVYYIIGQITGGAAVADVSLADLSDAITRINDLADDIFTTTTNAGSPALWDGTNTLSIGGDTNVQAILTTHESRLDTAETDINTLQADVIAAQATADGAVSVNATQSAAIASLQSQIASGVGLPTPVASAQAEAADSASPIQVLAVDTLGTVEWIDLLAQVKRGTLTDAGNYFTTKKVEEALQEIVANSVKWAGGARIDNGATAGEILSGTALFKEGNFEYTGTPSATKFTTTRPGNNHFYIYPPTGTTPSNYIVQMFKYVAGTTSLEATPDLLIWDAVNSRWDVTMSSTLAIYFLKVL